MSHPNPTRSRRLPGATAWTIATLFALPGLAQEADVDELRSEIRAEKEALVRDAMELDEHEGRVFWPIYRRYEDELGELGDRRIELIREYAASHGRLTDAQARDLAGEWLDLQGRRLKLERQAWKQLDKELSPTLAALFLQVEHRIRLRTDLEIASQLPPILP